MNDSPQPHSPFLFGLLNSKQFESLIQLITKDFSLNSISIKLDIYNIKAEYYHPIIRFCKEYHSKQYDRNIDDIQSKNLEITRHNYQVIIERGGLETWKLIQKMKNQEWLKFLHSLKTEEKKRFFLAKISKIIPIKYKIRYRVFFLNPRIVFF